jgi:phosphoserine phosphatase RsbU/P
VAKDDSPQQKQNDSSSSIFKLGNKLAATDDIEAQKQNLIEILQNKFDCTAYIWLNSPLTLHGINNPNFDFPFDPESSEIRDNISENGSHLFATSETHWLVLPLSRGGNEFGRIILCKDSPFVSYTHHQLQDISAVAGLVIFATIQMEMQNWRQKQLTLVREVAKQISQITDLDVLTDQITHLVQQTFNFSYVAVFLIDPDSQRLKFHASATSDEYIQRGSEPPEFERDSHPGFSLGEHMIGYVAQTREELIANDVTQEPRYKEVDSLADTKSEVVLPLQIGSQIFGVFDVQSDTINAFNEDDLLVLRALADNIAIAIESTRLFQGMQQRIEQLATVSEVSRAITSILDTDKLLKQIVSLIQKRFDYPHVHIYTVDPAQNKINFKAGSGQMTSQYEKAGTSFSIDSEKGLLSWVVRNGKTKRANNIKEEPLYLRTKYLKDSGSEMAIPLSYGGETLGVLDLHSNQINAFSQSDQSVMETLGDNIAIAIRNARLYRSERWRRQVAESLRDVAALLSEKIALDSLLESILDELHKNLPCDIAGIWLFDADAPQEETIDNRKLILAACKTSEYYIDHKVGDLSFIPDEWVKNALRQKNPTIRKPDESSGPITEKFNLPSNYSSIAVPLTTDDEILGMLTLDHHTSGRYGSESQKITSAFASYAAVAIKNARLHATSQEQAWISTILLQVATATQSITDVSELASTIVRLTPMVVGVKGCAFFLRAHESELFSLYASYGIGETSENFHPDQPILFEKAPIFEELLLTHEALHIRHPEEDFGSAKLLTPQLTNEILVLYPIISRDKVLGAFLVSHDTPDNQPTGRSDLMSEERYRIIQGIIQQTAVALENIQLLEENQEEAYISAVLLQSAQAVVSSADLDDTLNAIVQIMPILVGVEASVIYLWNDQEKEFQAAQTSTKSLSEEGQYSQNTFKPGDFPMLDAVFQQNRPVVYPFIENPLPPEDWDLVLPNEDQIDPTPFLKTRYPLLMGFPLAMKDDVFGVLLAQDKSTLSNRERRFELLWGMAQQASLAIQNDIINREMIKRQHLEREFQLAREIQQTFLPSQKPDMPGWDMDVLWEPARQVGGDFYDYFLLPDGHLAFLIADVSDKGLAASLYMTVTRTLLRAAALEYKSPSKTLERVNDLLLMNSQNGLFVTTFYGVLNLESGALTYSIAGHNPPLIIRMSTNEVEEMPKGGIAIGAMPQIKLNQEVIQLDPGDCLLLYTDGVTEAFNFQDQMYGELRLNKTLLEAIGKSAGDVLSILKADLEDFRGNAPLSDDTTILAICRKNSLTNHHG